MQLSVNGVSYNLPDRTTVLQLMETLGVKTDGTAVEVNREIVPRAAHPQRELREGDSVEIVTFVGGG
jgi:sulfur carrier protein